MAIRDDLRASFLAVAAIAAFVLFPAPWAVGEGLSEVLPPQPLADALDTFARHTGFEVVYRAELARKVMSQGARAGLTPQETLQELLRETGLTFDLINDKTVAIRPIEAQASSSVPQGTSNADSGSSRNSRAPLLLAQAEGAREQAPDEGSAPAGDAGALAELEEVVVTGTHIRGVRPQSSPLSVYTAEDIRRSGVTTIDQFVQKLPQNHGGVFASAPLSTGLFNPESATGIDLRGLGIGTTLVLLNGRRMALAAGGRTVDVSMIPLGAVDRLEVLTDGASGIYGSDAVGGVVNVVLKDNFEGGQTELGYGSVTDGGLDEKRFEQTLGHRWGSGHGVISYHYLNRSDLDASERDFATSASPYTLSPPDRRHSAFLSVHQDGPAGVKLSGDALFSSRDTSSLTSHPLTGALDDGSTDETQYFADLAARREIAGSVTGEIVASYSLLESEFDQTETFPGETSVALSDFDHSVFDVTGKLDGDVLALRGGMVKFSVGAGYTGERYVNKVLFNDEPSEPLRLKRHTKYAFGELFAPILSADNAVRFAERLELSLSARFTDYSDFGGETSPRVGLLWSPASFLSIRGTYSESFRAPSLIQLDPFSQNVIFSPADFNIPDPFSNDGSSVVLLASEGSNAGLNPERAKTYTAGLDWHPESVPEFSLGMTYFKIDYEDRILAPFTAQEPFNAPGDYADVIYHDPDVDLLRSIIDGSINFLNTTNVDPTDPQALATVIDVVLDGRRRNLALSNLDGVDVSLQHRIASSSGAFSMGAQFTYLFDYDQQNTQHGPVLTVMDTVLHPVSLKGRAYIGLSSGIWSGQLNLNYVDRYENPFGSGPTQVPSWTTFDLSVTCGLDESVKGPLANTRLSLSVQNLLDRDPPFVAMGTAGNTIAESIGYDPTNADPTGRFIALSFSKGWK